MKVSPRFYNDGNDVYWKEKLASVTYENFTKQSFLKYMSLEKKTLSTIMEMSYRDYYELIVYDETIKGQSWTSSLLKKMLEDDLFLERHIDARAKDGWTALMFTMCIEEGHNYAKILLAAGANPNLKNNLGWTALMIGAVYHSFEGVKRLLEARATVDIKNMYGTTALMMAYTSEVITQNILDAGADVDLQDNDGNTALIYAARRSAVEVVKLLLAAGANVDLRNRQDSTALSLAENAEIIEILSRK